MLIFYKFFSKLSKFFDDIKIKFLNRSRSPSTSAKSKNGDAFAVNGKNNSCCIDKSQNKTINNFNHIPKNALEDESSWGDLIKSFSPDTAVKVAKDLLNPRLIKDQQNANHLIKWISKKFQSIEISSINPEKINFIDALDQSKKALKLLSKTQECEKFYEDWKSIEEKLSLIKQKIHKNNLK